MRTVPDKYKLTFEYFDGSNWASLTNAVSDQQLVGDNLTQTFTYLNCALQNQYLNRGEWRLLEEQERVWDDKEPLTVIIKIILIKIINNTSKSIGLPKFIIYIINQK